MIRALFFFISVLFSCHVAASIDTYTFKNEAQEQQFRQITEQLRCPKCQNNSIADSNAMIASDMKLKVYELMQQGKSKQEIIDYMVARYGHFVTYDPPLTSATVLLWLVPALFILAGVVVIVKRSRLRQRVVDFPDDEQTETHDAANKVSYWVFIPGLLVLIIVTLGTYLKTSGWRQVLEWQQITRKTPELLNRVMNPQATPLTLEEMARLGLGLRTRLQQYPDNLEGWVMLGRIGMVLNNLSTARQAFAHAYKLSPDNFDARLGYAETLIHSTDAQDNQKGNSMLREMLKIDHTNVQVLSLLAFSAFEQQNYREAIGAWSIMLKLIPANDNRRDVIVRSIEQAKAMANAEKTENAGKK